jgi:hypothetical protein
LDDEYMLPLQIGPCPPQADLAAATPAGPSNGELLLSRWLFYFSLKMSITAWQLLPRGMIEEGGLCWARC